jgi:septum formation topological specificity factor MinE
MKKILILTLIIILISTFASAKDLHKEWHYSGDSFEVDGEAIVITHYDFNYPKVSLSVGEKTSLVEEGDCYQTPKKEYCVEEIYTDINESDHIKFVDGDVLAGIYFKVSTRGPDVDIKRSFSTKKPSLEERVDVTITIENDGDEYTNSFFYEEQFPDDVKIKSYSEDFKFSNNKLIYVKNIPANDEVELKYSFVVNKYIQFDTEPTAMYVYESEENSIDVSSVSIEVPKPYDFSISSSSSVDLGDSFDVTVKVGNEASDTISVEELKITIPQEFSIGNIDPDLKKNNQILTWSGELLENKGESFKISLKALRAGEFTISSEVKLLDSLEKPFSEKLEKTIESKLSEAKLLIGLKDKTISEGSYYRMSFSVENPNEKTSLNDINIEIFSDLFDTIYLDKKTILQEEIITLYVDDMILAPFVEKKMSFDITAKATYMAAEKLYSVEETEKITITPVDDIISISKKANTKTINSVNATTITVSIKNNNDQRLSVFVKDILPKGIDISGGKKENNLIIDGKETVDVYSYSILLPENYANETFESVTTAYIESKEYTANKTLSLKVDKIEESSSEDKEENKQEETSKPEKKATKEKGFFQKFFESIGEFFSNIFG